MRSRLLGTLGVLAIGIASGCSGRRLRHTARLRKRRADDRIADTGAIRERIGIAHADEHTDDRPNGDTKPDADTRRDPLGQRVRTVADRRIAERRDHRAVLDVHEHAIVGQADLL